MQCDAMQCSVPAAAAAAASESGTGSRSGTDTATPGARSPDTKRRPCAPVPGVSGRPRPAASPSCAQRSGRLNGGASAAQRGAAETHTHQGRESGMRWLQRRGEDWRDTARHGTARHITARHNTARHGTARRPVNEDAGEALQVDALVHRVLVQRN
jgi:hypothetical protein